MEVKDLIHISPDRIQALLDGPGTVDFQYRDSHDLYGYEGRDM